MDMKEKGLSFLISLRVCYVCPPMLWPLTLPLSTLCLHGHGARLIHHSNVIINPDGKCHIKQESRESTLHILRHAISKSSSLRHRLTCVTWVKLQAGTNLVFRKHLLCQLCSAVKTQSCRLGIRPVKIRDSAAALSEKALWIHSVFALKSNKSQRLRRCKVKMYSSLLADLGL